MTDVKKVVRDFYESYNDRDLDTTWERYMSPDLVNHAMGGVAQRAEWLAMDKALFPAFADLHVEVLDQISEGDVVATRYRFDGTHTGDFLGIPASGNKAALTGTSFDRIAGGKIAEHWADVDFAGFMQQLSAAPTTSATRRPAVSSASTAEQSQQQLGKQLITRWIEIVNRGAVGEVASVWAEDAVVHPGGGLPEARGISSLEDLLGAYLSALPDIHVTIDDLVAEGDRVAARFFTRGTHSGVFLGMPATGKPVGVAGYGIFRLADGKITEEWLLDDLMAFATQVGAFPTAESRP